MGPVAAAGWRNSSAAGWGLRHRERGEQMRADWGTNARVFIFRVFMAYFDNKLSKGGKELAINLQFTCACNDESLLLL